jgi:hypothetical protein
MKSAMRHYVYAIHTDDTRNRRYGSFENFRDAEKLAQDMRAARYPRDNYRVAQFVADNDEAAEREADKLRPFPKMRPSS